MLILCILQSLGYVFSCPVYSLLQYLSVIHPFKPQVRELYTLSFCLLRCSTCAHRQHTSLPSPQKPGATADVSAATDAVSAATAAAVSAAATDAVSAATAALLLLRPFPCGIPERPPHLPPVKSFNRGSCKRRDTLHGGYHSHAATVPCQVHYPTCLFSKPYRQLPITLQTHHDHWFRSPIRTLYSIT